jgi:peptidyl-prolyl cis-trans isomerase A (cyclophilin A)
MSFNRLTLLGIALLLSGPVFATHVTMQTPFGEVEIELFDEDAPETVANFLNYVNDGDYANSFIHRAVPGFVVQGGGFAFIEDSVVAIPTDPPVINEPGISNQRGTIAMAKLGGDPNSANNQWFFNLDDNSSLDSTNGGFTVFGQVTGDGMEVIDQIAALPLWNFGSPFVAWPMIDYPGSGIPSEENLVMIDIEENSIEEINTFLINPGLNDAWYNPATNGQGFFIIVYPEIEQIFLSWFTFDTERPDDSVPANLGEPGHRWLTAQGPYAGNKAVLDILVTKGGVFDAATPEPVTTKDGTIIIEFSGCEAGTISYDIPSIDRQGVVPIERVVPDNLALCIALGTPVAK